MNQSITLTPADIQLLLEIGFWYMASAVIVALVIYDIFAVFFNLCFRFFVFVLESRGPVEKPVGGKSE